MTIPPDLAVEVISPTNLAYEVQQKIIDYIEAGVRLVWVVYPNTRRVQVYDSSGLVGELGERETISGSDVVPGFSCSVAEFFRLPGTPARP